jgi:hypothetical protein
MSKTENGMKKMGGVTVMRCPRRIRASPPYLSKAASARGWRWIVSMSWWLWNKMTFCIYVLILLKVCKVGLLLGGGLQFRLVL